MNRTLICTSGTSAITNMTAYLRFEKNPDNNKIIINEFLKELQELKSLTEMGGSFVAQQMRSEVVREKLGSASELALQYYLRSTQQIEGMELPYDKLTAELAGLLLLPVDNNDRVKMLVSDTLEGYLSALITLRFLREKGVCNLAEKPADNILVINGLQDKDMTLFQTVGLPNLLEILLDERKEAVISGREVWLNITGGFKGILPYLTYFSVTYGIPMFYRFERSKDVVILPGFPLKWDEQYLKDLNRFFNGTHNLRFIKENQSRISPLFEDEGFQENTRYGDFVQRLIEDLVEEE